MGVRNAGSRKRWYSEQLKRSKVMVESRGWGNAALMAFMVTSAAVSGFWATWKEEKKVVREYSSPEKWSEPKYATLSAMKTVSFDFISSFPSELLYAGWMTDRELSGPLFK